MTPLDRLRELAELLPPGGAVSLTREALLELAGAGEGLQSANSPAGADLTVAGLAAHFHRSESTIHAWLAAGRFVGAYRLPSSEKEFVFRSGKLKGQRRRRVGAWRIPAGALEAFAEQQRHPGRRGAAQLGEWRKHRRRA